MFYCVNLKRRNQLEKMYRKMALKYDGKNHSEFPEKYRKIEIVSNNVMKFLKTVYVKRNCNKAAILEFFQYRVRKGRVGVLKVWIFQYPFPSQIFIIFGACLFFHKCFCRSLVFCHIEFFAFQSLGSNRA